MFLLNINSTIFIRVDDARYSDMVINYGQTMSQVFSLGC